MGLDLHDYFFNNCVDLFILYKYKRHIFCVKLPLIYVYIRCIINKNVLQKLRKSS